MRSFTFCTLFLSKLRQRGTVHFFSSTSIKVLPFLLLFLTISLNGKGTSSGNTAVNPTNFIFEVNKINYTNNFDPPSPFAYLIVTFTPGDEGKYLSVFAENNSEGISGFIVENLYLPAIEGVSSKRLSTSFPFSIISFSFKVPLTLKLTAYINDFVDFYPFEVDSIADTTTVVVTVTSFNADGAEVPDIIVPTAAINDVQQAKGDSLTDLLYRPDVDNVDLDSSGHPPTTTYAGDRGACAPAAAANSFKWLEKRYPDVKLPKDLTLRKTLETLSENMRRQNNQGTTDFNMIKGKLDFIVQYRLPVDVKFQCIGIEEDITGTFGNKATNLKDPDGKPSYEFLKQMLAEGEDVEMTFTWKDTSGEFVGAHTVTVTGVQEYASGLKKVTYKHDTNQSCPGGTKEETDKIGNDLDEWLRFGPSYGYYITCIIAESPDGPPSRTVSADQAASAALTYELTQNYPNPFNPVTNISYTLKVSGFISLIVYDVLGREVKTLVNEEQPSGVHNVVLDASSLTSGVYYYKITTGDFADTKKLILLK